MSRTQARRRLSRQEGGSTPVLPLPNLTVKGQNTVVIPSGNTTFDSNTDFGTIALGVGNTRSFYLENTGEADLTVAAVYPPSGFTLIDPSPFFFPLVIGPGSNQAIVIEADAEAIELYEDTVTIESDASENPFYTFDIRAYVYFTDTFGRSDGPLGNGWEADTWQIVGNEAVNLPGLGAELLTDGSMEGTYISGGYNGLFFINSPVKSQSADAADGVKAQQIQNTAAGISCQWGFPPDSVPGTWYQFSIQKKRISGTGADNRWQVSNFQAIPTQNNVGFSIVSGSYVRDKIAILARNVDSLTFYPVTDSSVAPYPVVNFDDLSVKEIDFSTITALQEFNNPDVTISLGPPDSWGAFSDSTLIGIVLRADAVVSPSNYIMATVRRGPGTSQLRISLFKRVGSTYTPLISEAIVFTVVPGANLTVTASGSTVTVLYDNTQIGSAQVVSDVALLSNTKHGMMSTGDNKIQLFSVQA